MRYPARLFVHAGFAAIAIAIIVSAGQPIFTDDLWWHLSLGTSFLEEGPWLSSDPLLFRSAGPPSTSSWLAEVVFAALDATFGFTGLRIFHAAFVAAILGLAWSIFRRASGCAGLASLATSGFAILAAYRLVQLRPHLFSVLGVLLLYRLVFEGDRRPGPIRVALLATLVVFWVNLHAGFLLAPLLLGAAMVAEGASVFLARLGGNPNGWGRLPVLAVAGVVVGAATFVNPAGSEPHLAYLLAGRETPDLGRVVDEWKSFGFFRWPIPNLPPTPLAWVLGWLLAGGTAWAGVRGLHQWWRPTLSKSGGARTINPALVGLSVASLVAMATAVRFEWLGIFGLLLAVTIFRPASDARAHPVAVDRGWVAAALGSVALVPLFFMAGPWTMISGGWTSYWDSYRQAYPPAKYYGHGMGWLADVGLEGHLYTDYSLGGFAGYWLAPRLRTLFNGSLNVPPSVVQAGISLGERSGGDDGLIFRDLLDQQQVDVFFGTGLPRVAPPNRPWRYTTSHLEEEEGWVLAFRNVRSAIYLRKNPRNRGNLEKVESYYRERGIPFDSDRGFEVERVVRANPEWAFRNGVIPSHFRILKSSLGERLPNQRWPGQAELARLYAVLGGYETAVDLDRQRLRVDPTLERVRRRLVWSLLRLGRFDEADAEAEPLRATGSGDGLTAAIASAARTARDAPRSPETARLRSSLPLLSLPEANAIGWGFRPPEPRGRP